MKSQKQLEQELDEKDKVLQFLRQKYEEDTGKKLEIPLTWASFLCIFLLKRDFKKLVLKCPREANQYCRRH